MSESKITPNDALDKAKKIVGNRQKELDELNSHPAVEEAENIVAEHADKMPPKTNINNLGEFEEGPISKN